jgi:hypothetical protein
MGTRYGRMATTSDRDPWLFVQDSAVALAIACCFALSAERSLAPSLRTWCTGVYKAARAIAATTAATRSAVRAALHRVECLGAHFRERGGDGEGDDVRVPLRHLARGIRAYKRRLGWA